MRLKYDRNFYRLMETNNIFLSSYQNNILVRSIVSGIHNSISIVSKTSENRNSSEVLT